MKSPIKKIKRSLESALESLSNNVIISEVIKCTPDDDGWFILVIHICIIVEPLYKDTSINRTLYSVPNAVYVYIQPLEITSHDTLN